MMTPSACAAALAGVLLLAPAAPAHEPAAQAKAAKVSTSVEAKSVTIKLLDLELLDQDGTPVRFKRDVVRDRLVVIGAIYTTCPVVCPIVSSVFSSLQESLGERLGKDVLLVSISVDPTTDIPPRLKEYAQRWQARPGWRFLTGPKRNVDEVLKGLNAWAPDFRDHPGLLLVGDGRHGHWRRLYGFPAPQRVLAELEELGVRRAEALDRFAPDEPATRGGRGR